MSKEEELAQDFIDNLKQLLLEDIGLLEMPGQVVLLLDDYHNDLETESSELERQSSIQNLIIDDTDDVEIIAYNPSINRGFILDKATTLYYKQNELDANVFASLSPTEKVGHRKKITELFNKLLSEANSKPNKLSERTQNLSKTVIKRINVDVDIDSVTEAENAWYKEQIQDLKTKILICNAEITELERQNAIKQIGGMITARNIARLAELKNELEKLEVNLQQYYDKTQ